MRTTPSPVTAFPSTPIFRAELFFNSCLSANTKWERKQKQYHVRHTYSFTTRPIKEGQSRTAMQTLGLYHNTQGRYLVCESGRGGKPWRNTKRGRRRRGSAKRFFEGVRSRGPPSGPGGTKPCWWSRENALEALRY